MAELTIRELIVAAFQEGMQGAASQVMERGDYTELYFPDLGADPVRVGWSDVVYPDWIPPGMVSAMNLDVSAIHADPEFAARYTAG